MIHLMTLYNTPSPLVHDLEVGEDLHGMVMLMAGVPVPRQFGNCRSEVSGARIGDGSGEPGTTRQFCPKLPTLLPEQPSCVRLPVRVRGSLHIRLLGHAVLLHGTLQEEKWFVLQVRRGHQLVQIRLEVSLRKRIGPLGLSGLQKSHLSVSANHSCQVVEALPWAEEVPKVVVVAINEAFLFPVAIKSAHHPGHVLPTKDGCRNCRTCISAGTNL